MLGLLNFFCSVSGLRLWRQRALKIAGSSELRQMVGGIRGEATAAVKNHMQQRPPYKVTILTEDGPVTFGSAAAACRPLHLRRGKIARSNPRLDFAASNPSGNFNRLNKN
jgi:hypothetical protein